MITIYADSNIYRYVANGELAITTVGPIRFAYSSVHFDEMVRTGNTEMLRGIEALKAVEVVSNEHGEYDIDDIGVCLEYVEPFNKFGAYKEAKERQPDAQAPMRELLLALLGSDNYEELRNVPNSIVETALGATDQGNNDSEGLIARASQAASGLEKIIENDLSTRRPLSETREALGFPHGATSKHGNDNNPIDGIWNHIKDKAPGISKDQFFGFEKIPGIGEDRSRLEAISACHMLLNMVGLHPDKGLPKRERIENIISDGHHLGYASLCGGFLTSDHRLFKKAQAIFQYRNFATVSMYVPYKSEGMSTTLVNPSVINTIKLERNG